MGKLAAGIAMSFLFYLLLARPLNRSELLQGFAAALLSPSTCGPLSDHG